MRFLKANKLFNGEQFLPETTVLVLENNGILKDTISESDTDALNIETLNCIITPGFINAHCHLELSHLKGIIPEHTGLSEFAKQVIINRNKIVIEERIEHQLQADKAMWEAGIVTVGDICNTTESFKTKQQSTIFYHSFVELLGLNPLNAQGNFNKGVDLLNEFKNNELPASLAPHAPYSTSNELIKLISEFNLTNFNVSTIHNQESDEETIFFMGDKNVPIAIGIEKLYAFLKLDISWFNAPNTSSLKHYYSSLRNQNTILVHNTVTKKEDIDETNNSTTFWCFCPNANLYIENKVPNFELFSERKNTICVGTDSLASNMQLDLISEVNIILKQSEVFNLETVLQFITKNGANALSIQDKFGSFIIGKNVGLNLISFFKQSIKIYKKNSINMLYLKSFCFNPFQQNTYLVYDDEGTTFIIDPGNFTTSENTQLTNFISEKKLNLTRLLLTHAHIDHILGNKFIFDTYGLLPEVHKDDLYFIDNMIKSGAMYGVNCEQSPSPVTYINDGDVITLGNYEFECVFTPGHSPGSISFYNKQNKLLISGDVLFYGSIGRTDLPMGNHQTLINSIKQKLFLLDDDTKVYSGHGQATSIGFEKINNPFLV